MKKSLLPIVFLLILAIASQPVNAVALGVNKASLNYDNVLRNGYAQNTVTVTTDSNQNISLEYHFTGELADWMRIEPTNESELYFSSGNPLELTIIAEPPTDAANGVYTGKLRLLTGEFARVEGEVGDSGVQAGSSLKASFAVDLSVQVTGDQIVTCTAGGFDITDTERGYPLELHSTVQNTGNVQLEPNFLVDIWNKQQTEVVMSANVSEDESILPTTQESFINQISHNLTTGQYWAQIREPTCGNGRKVTFNIVELGGISDKGRLLRIDNQPWANTDDIIRIAAVFKNTGQRVVNAKFKGTIKKNGQTVDVINTDPLQVNPDNTQQLESFFNPTEPGKYTVTGRVIYNNKLTFEKSSIINVQGEVGPRVTGNVVEQVLSNPYQIAMILIVLAIAGLIYLIRKEKRKRKY